MKKRDFIQSLGMALLLSMTCAAASALATDDRSENAPILLAHSYTTKNGPQMFSCFHETVCETKEVEYVVGTGENGLPIIERKTVSECSPSPNHTCTPIN